MNCNKELNKCEESVIVFILSLRLFCYGAVDLTEITEDIFFGWL
jgi:hypothetical protein